MRYVAGKRSKPRGQPSTSSGNSALGVTARYKPLLDFFAASAALTVPYVALRVLIVAHYDLDVAAALAVTSDPVRLALSALLLAMPILLAAAGIACAFHGARKARKQGKRRYRPQLPWLALALVLLIPVVLTYSSGDWPTAVSAIALLSIAMQAGWFIDEPNPKLTDGTYMEKKVAEGLYRFAPVFLAVVLVGIAILAPMWLPAERVYIKGEPMLAYFLSEGGDEDVLFIPQKAAVQRVPVTDLSGRQYCKTSDYETVGEAIFGGPRGLPTCP